MKKNTYVTMWYFSVVSLSIALIFFVLSFLGHWPAKYYIPFASLFSLSVILFGISYKPLKCDNGHNLIQAISYYRSCKQKGFKSNKDKDILISVAEEMDILSDCQTEDKMNFYQEGKKVAESIKNPMITFFWKIQDKLITNKN